MSRTITSVEGLIRKVFKIAPQPDEVVLYRGHADRLEYKLEPSIFRDPKHLLHEDVMFRELITSNPSDFSDDSSTLEKLVRMQHYSLPTRLLDLTSNPLMALYFACSTANGSTGEVIIFTIKKSAVYFYDSDTTSVISNLARMNATAKDGIKAATNQQIAQFNQVDQVDRLLQFIREEKPYFCPLIKPSDISRIICVKTKMSNSRIVSQAGSFLLFGHDAKIDKNGAPGIGIGRVPINGNQKVKILKELDSLNINESTVFPYIENSAKYIRQRYKT